MMIPTMAGKEVFAMPCATWMSCFQTNERFVSPPVKVDLVDAVGAGDSFDAGFLHQFLRGADLETCLANGNLAGALSTTRAGGTEAFRDPEHRKRFFETHKSAMK